MVSHFFHERIPGLDFHFLPVDFTRLSVSSALMISCSPTWPNLNLNVLGKRTICYSLLGFFGIINAYAPDIFPLIYKRGQMRVKCGMNAG